MSERVNINKYEIQALDYIRAQREDLMKQLKAWEAEEQKWAEEIIISRGGKWDETDEWRLVLDENTKGWYLTTDIPKDQK